MEQLKYIEHCISDKFALFILMALFFSNNLRAERESLKLEIQKMPLVQEVNYTYQVISDANGYSDCIGTLELSLSLSADVERIIFHCTRKHLIDPDKTKLFFASRFVYSGDLHGLTKSDISWGTYFKIEAVYKNGDREYSPIYCVNDYISMDDLNLFLTQASINGIYKESINVTMDNRCLFIYSQDDISVSIYDTNGFLIYINDKIKSTSISLDSVRTPFVIMKYKTSKDFKTIKLLIR